ncbi:MAG: insulinase family protein, partial [Nitrospinota bacterium]
YGAAHPFGRPILGTRRSVARLGRGALRRYHRRCYHPARAVFVLAGPIEEEPLIRLLRRRLAELAGGWAARPPAVLARGLHAPPASPREGPRAFSLRGRSSLAYLDLAFAAPPITHPDAPALEVLSMLLGSGDSSRLYRRLCVENPWMHEASSDVLLAAGPGLFFMGGVAEPGKALRAAEEMFRAAADLAGNHPPDEEEMERVRTLFWADIEFRRESVSGCARMAGYSQLAAGDARFAGKYLARLLRVTRGDVQRACARYLRAGGLTAGVFLPDRAQGGTGPRAFREAIGRGLSLLEGKRRPLPAGGGRKPAPAKTPPLLRERPAVRPRKEEEPHVFRLHRGGRLVVLPGGQARVFALRAVFLGGQRLEGEGRAGWHSLMSNAAPMASRELSSEEMARRVDSLGASLGGNGGRNSFGLYAAGLSALTDEIADLFCQVLYAPAFDEEDVALARREADSARRADRDDLGQLSRLHAMSLLYGAHPLGRHLMGSRASLARAGGARLRAQWRRWALPENMVIGAAGDVDPAALARKLSRRLKEGWRGAPAWRAFPSPAPPAAPRRPRVRWVRAAEASQAHLHLAYLGARIRDRRRFALAVVAAALGSQGGGLFWELRERRGLAYESGVTCQEGLDRGPFVLYAAVAPGAEEAALRVMRAEVARVREKGLGAEELERAKAFVLGDLLRSQQRAGARASELAYGELYGLGPDGLKRLLRGFEAVDAAGVRQAAREFLDPAGECLVVLGPH